MEPFITAKDARRLSSLDFNYITVNILELIKTAIKERKYQIQYQMPVGTQEQLLALTGFLKSQGYAVKETKVKVCEAEIYYPTTLLEIAW